MVSERAGFGLTSAPDCHKLLFGPVGLCSSQPTLGDRIWRRAALMAELRTPREPGDWTIARPPRRRTPARILVFSAALMLIAPACGGGAPPSPTSQPRASQPGQSVAPTDAGPLGEVTIGSNYSDQVPKDAFQAMMDYCAGEANVTPKINTVEHGAFQDSLNSYLQGTPGRGLPVVGGFRIAVLGGAGPL